MPVHDPMAKVRRSFLKHHRKLVCFPMWQEVLEVEFVRRCVDINMFTDDVAARCMQLGLVHAVDWFRRVTQEQELPSAVFGLAVRYYEREYGPSDQWLTPDIIREMSSRAEVNPDAVAC